MNEKLSALWKLPAGIALFVILLILPWGEELSIEGKRMGAVAALMAFWWVTEVVPISVTAMLPLLLFPLLGISDAKAAAAPFANHLIFLFMGGFFIALAIQRWNLHRRIALQTVKIVDFSRSKLTLGFMIATAFLSMWISNTAAAMIMVPIAMAVVEQIKSKENSGGDPKKFGTALMLAVAYSASIGGIGTLIGTPPNIVLANALERLYGYRLDFGAWAMVGIPLVVIFLPLVWLYLTKIAFRLKGGELEGGKKVIRDELERLGPMSVEEKRVMIVFAAAVFLWIFSSPKDFGAFTIPGVQTFFPGATDATIAMFCAVALFFIPAGKGKNTRLLVWRQAQDLPWGILILFGGGLALAEGFKITGLAQWIGTRVEVFAEYPHIILVVFTIALIIFLTELTSNTATTAMILPILAGISVGLGENPLMLMLPAAIAASCAFMLPVATPPNAIVFGSGQVTIPVMARTGFALNLAGIVIITSLTYLLLVPMFGIVKGVLPEWASP